MLIYSFIQTDDDPPQSFMQNFVLKPGGDSFYIQHDVFRLVILTQEHCLCSVFLFPTEESSQSSCFLFFYVFLSLFFSFIPLYLFDCCFSLFLPWIKIRIWRFIWRSDQDPLCFLPDTGGWRRILSFLIRYRSKLIKHIFQTGAPQRLNTRSATPPPPCITSDDFLPPASTV